MEDNVNEFKLDEESLTVLKEYGIKAEQQKGALAELRLQYLKSESRILQSISQIDKDYVEHLKRLAKENGLDIENQAWQYDSQNGVFHKK